MISLPPDMSAILVVKALAMPPIIGHVLEIQSERVGASVSGRGIALLKMKMGIAAIEVTVKVVDLRFIFLLQEPIKLLRGTIHHYQCQEAISLLIRCCCHLKEKRMDSV